MRQANRWVWLALATTAMLAEPVTAQWIDQSFDLQAGWNSIYLEVDPAPAEADALFQGLPVGAVWMWAHDPLIEGPPECPNPDDPSCTPAQQSGWYVWLPPADPHRLATTLRLIRGGRTYLIKASQAATWTITGKPNASKTKWRKGFNLVGFHVVDAPAAAPTFTSYLAPSPAHSNTVLYEMGTDGALSRIVDPANRRIAAGVGFWVKSSRDVKYDGPVAIDNGSLRGVDFGKSLLEHPITLQNLAASARDVMLTYTSSGPAPPTPPGLPTLAGDVRLSCLDYGAGSLPEEMFQWRTLDTESWRLDGTGVASSRTTLRLGVNRAGLAGAVLDGEGRGSEYQGLLEVTDGQGFLRRLPVSAQIMPAVSGSVAGSTNARPGLYLGHATVNQVAWVTAGARVWTQGDADQPQFAGTMHCFGGGSDGQACFPDRRRCTGMAEVERAQLACEDDADCPGITTCETVSDCPDGTCRPFCVAQQGTPCHSSSDCPSGPCSAETDATSLRPAPADFVFPIIIHLSDSGEYKMLSDATMMWQPEDADPDMPARYVLVTPECPPDLYEQLQAGSLQDGQPFAVRAATAAFSFDGDLPLVGNFDSILAGETIVEADHPLNPFRHRYHPDHDGLNSLGVPVEGEVYQVTRRFMLAFATDPPQGMARPGWGDTLLGGTYSETLEGLHKDSITVGGSFDLHRVSTISTLNAQ